VHALAAKLVSHIRRDEWLRAGDRVGVAVSGGIDSVALLRLLLELRGELGIVLSVVHFNHKLRGEESDTDEQFVADLARHYDLEFLSASEDVAGHAAREGVSVETAARELRYGFFRDLFGEGGERQAHGLKPRFRASPDGTAEAVPFPGSLAGPDGPLFHDASNSARERRALVKLNKIVTGHTLDDQAETVLMRVIRGTGVTGLSGIFPRIPVENDDGEVSGEIVRLMLGTRRSELKQYLKDVSQPWREDSTNSDHAFTRNRLRKLILPVLEREFNPAVAENLAELAEIARAEEQYWENEVAGWMGTAVHWIEPDWVQSATQKAALVQISPSSIQPSLAVDADVQSRIENADWLVANTSVSRPWFLSEPIAVQRRVVKSIGEHAGIPLEFKHVEGMLRFAAEEGSVDRELSLPLGWKLVRHREELLFITPDLRKEVSPDGYEYELAVPGRAVLAEIGKAIEAHRVPTDALAEYNPDQLLDADSLPGSLRVRNWRAGDRFWPAHTKSPKKVKELLQERHVAQPERGLWPVVLSGDEIVWVRGFPAHARYRAKAGRETILISERTWPYGSET
jgi:tRNA(Ile)-lysidine synthase